MIFQLKNECLTVCIQDLGAEMTSIRTNHDNLEYLWQPDPDIWPRQSPTLFPVIGAFEEDICTISGAPYPMGLHGFAKFSVFQGDQKSDTHLVMRLVSTFEMLKQYPFQFVLTTEYVLEGAVLSVRHTVENIDFKDLIFSIGEHPGFRCPLLDGETMEDYLLEFDAKEHAERHFFRDGFLTGEVAVMLEDEQEIPLGGSLFHQQALILKGLKSGAVTLKNKAHQRQVRVEYPGYPVLCLWSPAKKAPFVCIEPWYGQPGKRGDDPALESREGMLTLHHGEAFTSVYRIHIS